MTLAQALRLFALWLLCSVIALVIFVGVQFVGDRLFMASKVEEIGVWGIYVGFAMHTISALMLGPLTGIRATRALGLPAWLDSSLGLAVIAGWGVLGVIVIGRWKRRATQH